MTMSMSLLRKPVQQVWCYTTTRTEGGAGEGKVKEATQIEEHTIRSDRALLLFYGCIFILPALPSPTSSTSTVHTAHFLSPNTIP